MLDSPRTRGPSLSSWLCFIWFVWLKASAPQFQVSAPQPLLQTCCSDARWCREKLWVLYVASTEPTLRKEPRGWRGGRLIAGSPGPGGNGLGNRVLGNPVSDPLNKKEVIQSAQVLCVQTRKETCPLGEWPLPRRPIGGVSCGKDFCCRTGLAACPLGTPDCFCLRPGPTMLLPRAAGGLCSGDPCWAGLRCQTASFPPEGRGRNENGSR